MAEPTYISINLVNIITILLIAFLGMAVVGAAGSAFRSMGPSA